MYRFKTPGLGFVFLCEHDHNHLADSGYLVDNERPMNAGGGNQPGYERLLKWEFGGPGNGGDGGSGGKEGRPQP